MFMACGHHWLLVLYMDFLRMEGEMNFFAAIAKRTVRSSEILVSSTPMAQTIKNYIFSDYIK